VVGRPLEWLAEHLTACPACQQRLEQVEDRPDSVMQMIRRPVVTTWDEPRSRRPQALPPGEPPRLPGADTRLLYYRRVRLGSLVVAVVLAALLALRLCDPETLTSQDSIAARGLYLFVIIPIYAAGLAIYLWLRPEVSLARLRLLTSVLFALGVLVVGGRQYSYLVHLPPGGFEGPQHASTYFTGANILSVFPGSSSW
jgi:hypothetical protein